MGFRWTREKENAPTGKVNTYNVPTGAVEVTIRYAKTKEPVPGVHEVTASDANGPVNAPVAMGSGGLYILQKITPGTYTIRATLQGDEAKNLVRVHRGKVKVARGKTSKVRFQVERASLQVIVRDAKTKQDLGAGHQVTISAATTTDTVRSSDQDGEALYDPVAPGAYNVHATLKGVEAESAPTKELSVSAKVTRGEAKLVYVDVARPSVVVSVYYAKTREAVPGAHEVKLTAQAQGVPEVVKAVAGGKVEFHPVRPGKYTVHVTLKGQDAEPLLPQEQDLPIEVVEGRPYALVAQVERRAFLKLLFKTPEGSRQMLPKDFPVRAVFNQGQTSVQTVNTKLDDEAVVLGADNKPGLEVDPAKHATLTLEFPTDTKGFVVCEERGAASQTQELVLEDAPYQSGTTLADRLEKGHRLWRLPTGTWTLRVSDWEVDPKGSTKGVYDAKKFQFRSLEYGGTKVGARAAPAELTLDPQWQYVRFEYFDRYYGHSDHADTPVTPLPLLIEGYAEQQKANANPGRDKLTTQSNWTIGKSDRELVQCLPWIVCREDDGAELEKPDESSTLRFATDAEHRFLKSTSATTREFCKLDDTHPDRHDLPCPDRLRYYDLPAEWRSTCYCCRLSDKAADQDLYEFLAEKETTKDKPLTFSLDDMVLTDSALKPVVWGVDEELAIFSHRFAGPGWDTKPPSRPGDPSALPTDNRAGGLPPKPQAPSVRRWLSPDGVYRDNRESKKHWVSRVQMPRNYLADYPNWTRLVLRHGDLYEVFDGRTKFDATAAIVPVGARAAVRWHAVQAKSAGVDVTAAEAAVKHPDQDHPLFAFQRFSSQQYLARDTSHSVGTTSSIGRYDIALLRCCDLDGGNELAVCLQYGKWHMNYPVDPIAQPGGARAVSAADWSDRVTRNIPNRWNGRDSYSTPAVLVPRDPANLKLRVRPLMFMQALNQAKSHYRILVEFTERAWMNGVQGTGQMRPTYYDVAPAQGQPGRFSSAHEAGHMMALPDDYGETSNYASGYRLGFYHLVPGDPYDFDAEAMMKSNQRPRSRNYWHMAEWFRLMNAKTLSLKVVRGAHDDFWVQHHGTDGRSYLYWPMAAQTPHSQGPRGHYDLFLHRFGDDETNKVVLPNLRGGGQKFDGILVVNVKLRFEMVAFANENAVQAILGWIDSAIKDDFNGKWYATGKVTVNGVEVEFKRCLMEFVPRYLVATHINGAGWTAGKNAGQYANFVAQIAIDQPEHFSVTLKTRANVGDATDWAAGANSTTLELRVTEDYGPPPKLDARDHQTQVLQDFPKKFRAMLGLDENVAVTPASLQHLAAAVLTNGDVKAL